MLQSDDFRKRIIDEDETMLIQLDLLTKMNQCGFLTVDSQAGRKRTGISEFDKKHFITCERAYVHGFMLESKAIEFIKDVSMNNTDKNATYIPFCNDTVKIPSNLDVPLTYTKKGAVININTHMSMVLPEITWNSYRKQVKLNKTEPVVFVACWDIKWNRLSNSPSGLFTDILKYLH